MVETLDSRLSLDTAQLARTYGRLYDRGVTADDVARVTEYLAVLIEQGCYVASLIDTAVENAERDHPVNTATDAIEIGSALGHASSLCEAAAVFAVDASYRLRRLNP